MSSGFRPTLIFKALSLFVLWLLLSESYNLFHMSIGLGASVAVALLNTNQAQRSTVSMRWINALKYIPWLLWRIFMSGIHLSFMILNPRLPIAPKLFRYRTALQHESGIVLLGNSITLTPGTLTADVNDNELLIHAMDDESAEDVTSMCLENKVAEIFWPVST